MRLFQLKGGPTCLNLSVDDLHAESIQNPSEYMPSHISKLYILISWWDAPVTPQGHECCSAQKEDRDHEWAVASQTHGQVSFTGPPDVVWISHVLSSWMTNHHNPFNSSLTHQGQPRFQSHTMWNESTQLDDDSLMDEVETNLNYNANSYLSGNANKYNALTECLPAPHPCQVANQKRPRF